jgi:hypothetical protein
MVVINASAEQSAEGVQIVHNLTNFLVNSKMRICEHLRGKRSICEFCILFQKIRKIRVDTQNCLWYKNKARL